MSESIKDLNQKSTNEGFLYLLFYLTLIISDQTPAFFAIENIDTAFNPKMCREVIKHLISLEKVENVLEHKENKIDFIYELYGKGLFNFQNLMKEEKK